jgi:hypothetical protein
MSVLTISRFALPARTANAAIDGDVIVGRFGSAPLVIANAVRLAEEFANCPETPTRILKFTTKYAALLNPAKPEAEFRFELSDWRTYHRSFRNNWRSIAEAAPEYDRGEKLFTFPQGSHLLFSKRGNALQLHRLGHLLTLVLGSLPWERIRICPAAECKAPFFMAADLRDVCCGDRACIAWVTRRVKRRYWSKHGPQILAERKRNREEQQHGALQTR